MSGEASGAEPSPPLESLLRSRRTWILYLGCVFLPIELAAAFSRGNATLGAIFGCLTVVMWIELAASRGLSIGALRWKEFALDGF